MEQRRSACDACRRRRVRCDADQPCAQCIRHGISCTYGSQASRQSATAYARNLEQQVAHLQRQLQALSNPVAGPSASTSASPSNTSSTRQDEVDVLVGLDKTLVLQQANGKKVYGSAASLNLLRSIANMLVSERTVTELGRQLVEVLETRQDLPTPAPLDWLHALLPPKEQILNKCLNAIDVALVGHECISKAGFKSRLDALYENTGTVLVLGHKSFLALVYALLALDELYNGNPAVYQSLDNLQSSKLCGLNYFRASRAIVHDESSEVDLEAVIAMVLHVRYLLSASTFSDAHAALGTAITAATQIGLHIDDATLQDSFDEYELYERRRVFAVLNIVETILCLNLGIPRTNRADRSKQFLGLSREDLADGGVALIARDATTSEAETALLGKLIVIFAKIVDHQSEQFKSPHPASDWVAECDKLLAQWEQLLPNISDLHASPRILQGQLHLRLSHCGAHVFLYAPYLHHVGRDRSDPAWNMTGYEYGSRCIRAASQAVFIMDTLQAHDLLNRIHWYNYYILAWSATILAYFVMHSHTRVTIAESKRAALLANEMLGRLGTTNIAAKQIHDCIAPCMEMIAAAPES